MALPIVKELKGIIRLDTSDTYQFVLPYNGATPIQNSQAITNVEEVWIIVEKEDPRVPPITPTIVLPQISTFNGGWNVKIYVVNKGEQPIATTPRQQDPTNQDFINFGNSVSIGIKSICYLHIADNNLWACWTAQ